MEHEITVLRGLQLLRHACIVRLGLTGGPTPAGLSNAARPRSLANLLEGIRPMARAREGPQARFNSAPTVQTSCTVEAVLKRASGSSLAPALMHNAQKSGSVNGDKRWRPWWEPAAQELMGYDMEHSLLSALFQLQAQASGSVPKLLHRDIKAENVLVTHVPGSAPQRGTGLVFWLRCA